MQINILIDYLGFNLYSKLQQNYGQIIDTQRQNNALTNNVFKISTIQNTFIVKCFKQKFKSIHDIVKIHNYLHQQSIAPKLIEYNLTKYMLIEYHHNEETQEPTFIKDFSNAINILHNTKLNVNLRSYDKLIAYYINNLYKFNSDIAYRLKQYGETLLNDINKFPKNLALCHNDIHRDNLIISKSKCYLIDFEYASINDVYVDLASIYNLLDIADFKTFMDFYQDKNKFSFDLNKLLHYNKLISLITILWSYHMLNNNLIILSSINNRDYEKLIVSNMTTLGIAY